MNRQQLRTTDEDLAAEFGRVLDLFSRSLTTQTDVGTFCYRVNRAGADGLTWVQALERVAAEDSQGR